MADPWSALDAGTGKKDLYLDPAVSSAVSQAFGPYETSLQTLINDKLDTTTGYFGTEGNPLALVLENAFNSCGKTLTTYCQQQLSQTQEFVNTAQNAAHAIHAADIA